MLSREAEKFSYKLVLSDINKFAKCKAEREQVGVEPIDSHAVPVQEHSELAIL